MCLWVALCCVLCLFCVDGWCVCLVVCCRLRVCIVLSCIVCLVCAVWCCSSSLCVVGVLLCLWFDVGA